MALPGRRGNLNLAQFASDLALSEEKQVRVMSLMSRIKSCENLPDHMVVKTVRMARKYDVCAMCIILESPVANYSVVHKTSRYIIRLKYLLLCHRLQGPTAHIISRIESTP